MKVIFALLSLLFVQSFAGKDYCDEQERFDIFMCKSFMCTKCTLDWCMKSCQEVQQDFPTCRCESWPKARKTYSGGDFASKGKYGDAGDYAKAAAAFLSTEI